MHRKANANDETTQALKKITYGFYIVTSKIKKKDEPYDYVSAEAVNWLSQVSFDPPLVMAAIKNENDLHKTMLHAQHFNVNILGEAEKAMLHDFFRLSDADQDQKTINGNPYFYGNNGVPVLSNIPAWFECEIFESHHAGDHTMFIGKVTHTGINNNEVDPLVESNTNYNV